MVILHTGSRLDGLPDGVLPGLRTAAAAAWALPEDAFTLIWHGHARDGWLPPPSRGGRYCLITVKALAGRSPELKGKLALACVDALAGFGIPAGDIDLCFATSEPEDWLVAGRMLPERRP